MRVGIDIRAISDFGVGTYIRNIVRTLARVDLADEFLLIGDAERNFEMSRLPRNFRAVALAAPASTARGYFALRRCIRDECCDVLHIPTLFWLPPYQPPCPYLVTIHDALDYMYRATKGTPRVRGALNFYSTRYMLQHAARILAVSNFSKNDVARLFNIPFNRIEVLYNAIDDRFLLGHATDQEREFIRERYQVNYPFILYAGRISPHKNLVRIIEAFSALKTELAREDQLPDLKLIIIGDEVSRHPDLRRTVIRSGVQNDVRFLGFVPIDVLRIFYDTAKLFVFPSLYEGFGLPPLEAMAHGTPVVTSNASSLPEVVGNAAVMVNPENVFDIMRAMQRALTDQSLRDKLKARGYEQVRRFSWEDSVRRLVEVYRAVSRNTPAEQSDAVQAV
ncbi:MAG TPA: glycosyltransferase family 1 protein [Terriglobales bacterium]|nr:glycosyltransferase family 1 protein [Terriglobales bacterium]